MTKTTRYLALYGERIHLMDKEDGSRWLSANSGSHFNAVSSDFNPYALEAVLILRSRTHGQNAAERMVIAMMIKPGYTLYHAVTGVLPEDFTITQGDAPWHSE